MIKKNPKSGTEVATTSTKVKKVNMKIYTSSLTSERKKRNSAIKSVNGNIRNTIKILTWNKGSSLIKNTIKMKSEIL